MILARSQRAKKLGLALTCIALPIFAYSNANAAASNVGALSFNTTAVSETDTAIFYDLEGGVLNNSSTITGGNAVVSATAVSSSSLTNTGTITSIASAVSVVDGVTSITNSGAITASGFSVIGISISGKTASIVNTNTIESFTSGEAIKIASGASVNITNSGSGVIAASSTSGTAISISESSSATINNSAIIQSTGAGASIEVASGSSAVITNTGLGLIGNAGANSVATAVNVLDGASSITINNSALITSTASAPNGFGVSSIAIGENVGSVNITNTGSILGVSDVNGTISMRSGGTITNNVGGIIDGGTNAAIRVHENTNSAVTITNASNITASVFNVASAAAVDLVRSGSDVAAVSLVNSGLISNDDAGAAVRGSGAGTINVTNTGTITNTASGIAMYVVDGANFTHHNNAGGLITASAASGSGANTSAILVGSDAGQTTLNNSGTVIAYGTTNATIDLQNGATVDNAGTIQNGSSGAAIQVGPVTSSGIQNSTITNSGSILSSSFSFGTIDIDSSAVITNTGAISNLYTAANSGGAVNVASTVSNVTINNTSGTITNASGTAIVLTEGNTLSNGGDIVSENTAIEVQNYVISGGEFIANITNTGSITSSGQTASATGSSAVVLNGNAVLNNSGTITASGVAPTILTTFATDTAIVNSGNILNTGVATGTGISVTGSIRSVDNSGTINVGSGVGISVSVGTVTSGITNSGTILQMSLTKTRVRLRQPLTHLAILRVILTLAPVGPT